MMTIGQLFIRQCQRELLVYFRHPRLVINASLFFLMMIVFFPLTMPADSALIRSVIPGVIWMAVLLALLMASERLFQQDYDQGLIEQWLLSGYSLSIIIMAKISIHWLFTLLPLLFFTPLFALLFHFSWFEVGVLAASLIIATPAILCLCGLASAFSTGMRQKGLLMALILLPLTVPILIFSSSTLIAAMDSRPVTAEFAILLAISLLSVSFLPFAIASVIRFGLSD